MNTSESLWARPAAIAPGAPIRRQGGWIDRHWAFALALLVVATFVIRARYYGNPLIDVDEEFYLLAGDRLLHGTLPYVELWDRKPIGLFLLYAGIRLLGGDGILQYQLVASGFAAATAVMIAVIARRIAPSGAALVAALAYVPALAMSGGQGGQTPVFYNLPMAIAAWLVLGLFAPHGSPALHPRIIRRRGSIAMLLVGLALQIKYSAVFEGMFFGLALLWLAWRADPRPGARALDAALWIGIALAPTLCAIGWYAAIGQLDAFLYANFTSILARGDVPDHHQLADLRRIAVRMLLFLVPILISEWLCRPDGGAWLRRPGGRVAHGFIFSWMGAAVLGFAAFGTFFNHYALPLLPPLAIAAAPAFAIRARAIGPVLAGLVLTVCAIVYPLNASRYERRSGDAAWAARMTAVITPRLGGGCLYVAYGEPILYHLARSCLPSRWAFPFHLSLAREAPALGVDPIEETRRILASAPPIIVDRLTDDDEINFPVQALVRQTLRRDYRLVWSATHPGGDFRATDQIWARK